MTNLEHIPDGSTKCMINEAKVQMTPAFNKCRNGCIIGTKRKDTLSQIPK